MSYGWDDPADPPNDAVVVGDGRDVVLTTRGAGVGPNAFVTQGAAMVFIPYYGATSYENERRNESIELALAMRAE